MRSHGYIIGKLTLSCSAASDVVLADTTFPDTTFQLVKGLTSVKWDRIYPGTNVSHVIVVRPIKYGPFNFTSAVVQYVASEGSDSTVSGLIVIIVLYLY